MVHREQFISWLNYPEESGEVRQLHQVVVRSKNTSVHLSLALNETN